MVHTPLRAHVSTIKTLVEGLKALTTEVQDEQKKLREEMKENSFHMAPVRTRASEVRPVRESGHTPRTELWYFLVDHEEDMRWWERKPTHVLAARVQELKEREKGKSIRVSAVPVSHGQESDPLEVEVNLTRKDGQKHPIVTGPDPPCILGIDYRRNGYFKDPKGHRWAFGIAAVETEVAKPLNSLPDLSENPSAVGLLKVEEQQVPIATTTVHHRQYQTNQDSVIPIHKMIRELERQGVVSKTHSPFNSPIWPVRKSDGEWRLTVDYHGLNEATPLLSATIPDMLELQYELESKAERWYTTTAIANVFFSIPLTAECRPQFAFTWRGV
ncbi:hypothetical protein BTVI_47500 [Pitangus sulphuratus]|nr:hypothetical protein BTVI_47500 [Pitangus sulphuratus]